MSTFYNPRIDLNDLLVYFDSANPRCWNGGTTCNNLINRVSIPTGAVSATVALYPDPIAGNCFSCSAGATNIISATVTTNANISMIMTIWPNVYADKIPLSINADGYASGPNLFWTSNLTNWNTGDGTTNTFAVGYPTANKWGVYAVTNISGGNAYYYINGKNVGNASGRDCTTSTGSFVFGNFHGGGYQFGGYVQAIMLYNRALTNDEIFNIYSVFRGRYNL